LLPSAICLLFLVVILFMIQNDMNNCTGLTTCSVSSSMVASQRWRWVLHALQAWIPRGSASIWIATCSICHGVHMIIYSIQIMTLYRTCPNACGVTFSCQHAFCLLFIIWTLLQSLHFQSTELHVLSIPCAVNISAHWHDVTGSLLSAHASSVAISFLDFGYPTIPMVCWYFADLCMPCWVLF
jgi:hypothetical protein